MINATAEMFMSEYFLIKAILGKYLEDSEGLFKILGKVFLIPDADTDKLYSLSENETARAIDTDKDFMQHRRMRKYSSMIGVEKEVNSEWEEVASIKGDAILSAQKNGLISGAEASRNAVYTCLTSAAKGGAVTALRIIGLLQCEGIFLGKNEKSGIKNLSKAADWNASVSTLALLYYCKTKRGYNLSRLGQEVGDTPFYALYENAVKEYGAADGVYVGKVKLLEKSFGAGVLKRETYDPKYARILNSPVIGERDKEKAVFSLSKELLCAISDLPLKLSDKKTVEFDTTDLERVAVKRDKEINAITALMKNSDLRKIAAYRPVCLSCESKYVLDMYANALGKEDARTHVEIIDIAETADYDFDPTPNNIFVRSIDEHKDNRFFLFFRGEISERKTEAVKNILQSARRAKFHLSSPNVTLDLSAVLPVCFCDGQNAKLLKDYCDEVALCEIGNGELPLAVKDILEAKQKVYGVGEICFSGEVADILSGYGIDTAESLIDAAVRARRGEGKKITLSREILREYEHGSKQTIGF